MKKNIKTLESGKVKFRVKATSDDVTSTNKTTMEQPQKQPQKVQKEEVKQVEVGVTPIKTATKISDLKKEVADLKKRVAQKEVITSEGDKNLPNMVFVKGGTFQMGSNEYDDEKPIHSVTVKDFNIGKYEVTNAEFAAFLNAKGNQEEGGVTWLEIESSSCKIEKSGSQYVSKSGYANHPVVEVSWHGAEAYCIWLSKTTGQNYRLPTEAEWEYAARGGNKSNGYTYSGSNTIDEVAWYSDNSDSKTHIVGTKKANELGIYDMSGNVWEWCRDKWHGNYENAPTDGSAWLQNGGNSRFLRGGSWYYNYNNCRVTNRNYDDPGSRNDDDGFRVVRGD